MGELVLHNHKHRRKHKKMEKVPLLVLMLMSKCEPALTVHAFPNARTTSGHFSILEQS